MSSSNRFVAFAGRRPPQSQRPGEPVVWIHLASIRKYWSEGSRKAAGNGRRELREVVTKSTSSTIFRIGRQRRLACRDVYLAPMRRYKLQEAASVRFEAIPWGFWSTGNERRMARGESSRVREKLCSRSHDMLNLNGNDCIAQAIRLLWNLALGYCRVWLIHFMSLSSSIHKHHTT